MQKRRLTTLGGVLNDEWMAAQARIASRLGLKTPSLRRAKALLCQASRDEVAAWRPYTQEDFNSDEEYADYLKKRRVPELAWSVRYEREDGTCEEVQVVWSFDDFRFYLFRPRGVREE